MLSGIATATIGSEAVSSATASPRDWQNVPTPEVQGPITGGNATGEPLSASVPNPLVFGYTEEEYVISGEARPLGPAVPFPEDQRERPSDEPAAYETRLLVYRPELPRDFNGTVVVDWANVALQVDLPTWGLFIDHVTRAGYAYAVVSAQKAGVDSSDSGWDLVAWDPARYGGLHHPGDAYSYDILSQAVQMLRVRPRPDPDPVRGLNIRRAVATGASRSARYLRYYINEVQAEHEVVDGFLPLTSHFAPIEPDDIRDDVAPVVWVQSASETEARRRPDSGLFKLWEVAGASHLNFWGNRYIEAMLARDHGVSGRDWDESEVGQYGELEAGADTDTVYGTVECGVKSYNYFPRRYADKAGLEQVHAWVVGEEPPSAPRLERDEDAEGNLVVQTDDHGNDVGGVRLPPIDVPLATYDSQACPSFGRTVQFDEETLTGLYDGHEEYLSKLQTATEDAVEAGYLLSVDATNFLLRAERTPLFER